VGFQVNIETWTSLEGLNHHGKLSEIGGTRQKGATVKHGKKAV